MPGTVQAANYDTGGQAVANNVTSVGGTANSYGPTGWTWRPARHRLRVPPGLDRDGQWFKYTVNVATAGTYTVSLRLASPNGVTDALHIANAAGANLSGTVNAPDTGGWQAWVTATATATLPAGQQTLTVDQDNGGWNIHTWPSLPSLFPPPAARQRTWPSTSPPPPAATTRMTPRRT